MNLSSNTRWFTDDTIIYTTEENHQLQRNLERLKEWEKEWDVEFHPAKFQHISLTGKISPPQHIFCLHFTEIPRALEIKYLDVTVNLKLKFCQHITDISTKSNFTLVVIR